MLNSNKAFFVSLFFRVKTFSHSFPLNEKSPALRKRFCALFFQGQRIKFHEEEARLRQYSSRVKTLSDATTTVIKQGTHFRVH